MDISATSFPAASYGMPAWKAAGEDSRATQTQVEKSATEETGKSADTRKAGNDTALTQNEAAMVQELKNRDLEVRQHEQAHLSAAGGLARSAASYVMQAGPDGKRYAIGGEVQIDVSPGRTPEETLIKARMIQAAALAPAEPSSADRSIAARAQAMEVQASAEIAQRNRQEQRLASRYLANTEDLPRSTLATQA